MKDRSRKSSAGETLHTPGTADCSHFRFAAGGPQCFHEALCVTPKLPLREAVLRCNISGNNQVSPVSESYLLSARCGKQLPTQI